MEPVSKPKNRLWPLFFAIFVLFFLVVIVTVAIIGLKETAGNAYRYNETSESIDALYNAQIYFEKTRAYSKELILYADDSERAEQAGYLIIEYLNRTDALLNHYYAYVVDAQDMAMAQELSHLIIQYRDCMERMVGFGYSGEVEAMQALLLENEPLANEISVAFEMLFVYNQNMTMEIAWHTEDLTHTILLTLISVAVVTFILIILAAIVLIIITKPQDSEVNPATSGYQYRYRTDYTQTDGLSQAELQQCLADLRAVTNELSQIVNERQR